MEDQLNEPGQVTSMVAFNKNDDILFCGKKGVFVLSHETVKKRKAPVQTICPLDVNLNGLTPINLVKITNSVFLLQLADGDERVNMCFNMNKPEEMLLSYRYNETEITAACPMSDGSVIVARRNGQVQGYSSEIDVDITGAVDGVIVELEQGPISGLYFAGTENGSLLILRIDDKGVTVLDQMRLYHSALEFISVDTYGRAMVVASRDNDRVLVLGGNRQRVRQLLPWFTALSPLTEQSNPLSTSTDSPQSDLSVLVALAPHGGECIDAAITFELNADSLKLGEVTPINNLLELGITVKNRRTITLILKF